ncbi:MAG: hypothetical protein JW703_02095 [Candidatus Diapherotrites archaeon]|nr:hypothetical protein [Candidatus Diapherotrites archaeon]
MNCKIIALIFLLLFIFACTSAQNENPYFAEFNSFKDENFSFKYPSWGLHEPTSEKLLSISSGGAIIEVLLVEGNAEQLFKAMHDSFKSNKEVELLLADESKLFFTYKGKFQENTFKNSVQLIRCNKGNYSLNAICVEEVCDEVETIFTEFFNSVECTGFEEPEKQLIEFKVKDFSFSHPDWIELPDKKENELKKLIFGECLILLSSNESNPEIIFDSTLNALKTEPELNLIESDKQNYELEFIAPLNSVDYKIKSKLLYCNDKTYNLAVLCLKNAEKNSVDFAFNSLESMHCDKEYIFEEPEKPKNNLISFLQEDYSMNYPEWNPVSNYSIQTVLGVSNNSCTLIVNKFEATKKDLMNYLDVYIKENKFDLIEKKENEFIYLFEFDKTNLISSNKLIYCNYNTYVSTLVCPEELNQDFAELKNEVFDSVKCAKEYIPSEVYLPQEQEIPEEPPQNEEPIPFEDSIVKTNIGEQYNLNLRAIVDFINSNEFFVFVLNDFSKANFVIEDTPENETINLRITFENGKIILLEDSSFSNADVSLFIPFNAVMNIIENIENINFGNFLQFASSIRTEPQEAKTIVIQKVLEYLKTH